MYYPFVRGKQFELLMLREMAAKIAAWEFVPIIEPVKGNFPALKRALDALKENNCHFVLIGNPSVGDLKEDSTPLWTEIIEPQLQGYDNCSVGLNLSATASLELAENFFKQRSASIAIIHNGFSDGKGLATLITQEKPAITEHIFVEQHSTTLYRKHFNATKRILVQDGFNSRNNRDYPPSEPFSELYLTFTEMGCQGFGDFLIAGSEFREGGGPAYAIAIHLTYADVTADNAIAIKHYISDQVNTPKDPAGKYLEALRKLAEDAASQNTQIHQTEAVSEYLHLYRENHFPGLGYTKKLSMQHHVELMAHVLGK
jgi:hypothetical protein